VETASVEFHLIAQSAYRMLLPFYSYQIFVSASYEYIWTWNSSSLSPAYHRNDRSTTQADRKTERQRNSH